MIRLLAVWDRKARIITICICLFMTLLLSSVACAETDSLRIIVTYAENALNYPAEEAFFKLHPDTEIEYILYTEEQLYAHLQAGTEDADLVILPYNILVSMEEKGYLKYLDDAAGITGYPDQLVDWSEWLTRNDRLFALPVTVSQPSWFWNESVGETLGLDYPGTKAWTWEDYAELSEKFPRDTDGDGEDDTYLMYGSRVSAFPALWNANIEMAEQYIVSHSEFNTFRRKYLKLFRKIVTSPALLDMNHSSGSDKHVLLGINGDNPLIFLDHAVIGEEGDMLFLPPPTLDGKEGPYFGYLNACGMLQNAASRELASDFLLAMISEEGLNYSISMRYDKLISKACPQWEYLYDGPWVPKFVSSGGRLILRAGSGRNLKVAEFPYSEKAFSAMQDFRSRLIVSTVPFERDFYDALHAAIQEWLYGNIDDDSLAERMNYLLGIAANRK